MQTKFNQPFFQESLTKNDVDYKSIYTSCFPMVRSMVLKNSGSIDDARDIFQEAILVFYQNNSNDKFQLTASTCTYLYSIARNKWFKQIRNKGRTTGLDDSHELSDDKASFEDDEKMQKQRLLIKHLGNLGEKCRDILRMFFEGTPGEEISRELGFSSYEYYRVAKNRCTENLKKAMQQDPLFKELL